MRHYWTKSAVIGAATCATLLVQIAPGFAEGWHHRYKHRAHFAYVQYAPDYNACRVGWWQTLRYGHVRPHWSVWCR